MDKKSIIGLILIFVVMMGYAYFTSPSMKGEHKDATAQSTTNTGSLNSEATANQETANSGSTAANSANADQANGAANSANSANAASTSNDTDTNATNSSNAAAPIDSAQPFYYAHKGEAKSYTIENEVFAVNFQNLGGRVSYIKLKDYLTCTKDSLLLLDANASDFYIGFFTNNRYVRTDQLYFTCQMPEKRSVTGNDSLQIRMKLHPQTAQNTIDSGKYIEWVYTIKGNDYRIGFSLNFVGMQDIIASNTKFIDFVWRQNLHQYEKALNVEQMNTAVYYKPLNDDVDQLKESKDGAKNLTTPTRWISFKQQFFSVSLIADKSFESAEIQQIINKDQKSGYLADMKALIGIPYENKAEQSLDLSIYAGPNKYRILRDFNLDMERIIPLGWGFFLMQWINRFAVIPVFDFLDNQGLNYGLIILLLTILLKLVLSPITYKSYLSSAKMRVIQPEVNIINSKYPKQEQAMEKQKAVMALYKKAGVSPMAGCIPMLLQFPILIAMFRFFPASIELRQQPFLWADDLSSYDSVLNLPFNIPFYGSHVSLFALLMAITNLLYTRMTMKQSASTTQMPGMKFMMYAMPVMMLGFLNSYSSALNYYYCLSMLFTFLQMWIIRKFVNDEKVMARIQEFKKKPVIKSKFQQRLENMTKQQQNVLQQRQQKRK